MGLSVLDVVCMLMICRDDDGFGSVIRGGYVLPDGCGNLKKEGGSLTA